MPMPPDIAEQHDLAGTVRCRHCTAPIGTRCRVVAPGRTPIEQRLGEYAHLPHTGRLGDARREVRRVADEATGEPDTATAGEAARVDA
jgi:hypothetical protein